MVQPSESCLSTLMSAGNHGKIHGILKWIACGLSWKNIFSAVDSVLSRIIKEKAVEFHDIFPHGFLPNECVWQCESLFVTVLPV